MNPFNNPLDNLRVASPCPANWDEMYGNERKRFCAECKLNVYNLSDMTENEAAQLINAEGRVCVRFYRRKDGTVLTQDCPVGWAAVKRRISRVATAAFSMVAGFFGGLTAFNLSRTEAPITMGQIAIDGPVIQGDIYPSEIDRYTTGIPVKGETVQGKPVATRVTVGRLIPAPQVRKAPRRK